MQEMRLNRTDREWGREAGWDLLNILRLFISVPWPGPAGGQPAAGQMNSGGEFQVIYSDKRVMLKID